jgi:hypothetical protein
MPRNPHSGVRGGLERFIIYLPTDFSKAPVCGRLGMKHSNLLGGYVIGPWTKITFLRYFMYW